MSHVFFTDRNLGKRFPEILRAGGLTVERHDDHFTERTPDEEWLAEVSRRGWIAITHDGRIRYKPNELAAVRRYRASLFVVVGKAPFPDLAEAFLASIEPIERFLDKQAPPFIAKVYRGSIAEDGAGRRVPGKVATWYP